LNTKPPGGIHNFDTALRPVLEFLYAKMASVKNEDLLALKSYITAADATQYSAIAASTLVLDLTHSNLLQRHAEIRFDKHDTVDELRRRIHQKTGTPPHSQQLQLKSGGVVYYEILPNCESERMLGYYSLPIGANVHCIDIDPHSSSSGGAYEDTSLVEKYRMTEEEYDRRKGTLRDWTRHKKEKDPEFSLRRHAREHAELVEARRLYRESGVLKEGFEVESAGIVRCSNATANGYKTATAESNNIESDARNEFGPESIGHLSLYCRCQVQPGSRRGEIAYLGQIDELGSGGHWVGVVLDEPVGKTDGTVQSSGVKYFEAPGSNRGGFFRGKNVEVGDFPEVDIMQEFDDSEDEL
jgi:tubulin-folding cofactor B